MSTRYVWEKRGVIAVFRQYGNDIGAGSIIGYPYPGYPYVWTPGARCTFYALIDDGSLTRDDLPGCYLSPAGSKYNSFDFSAGGSNTKSFTFTVPEVGETVDITDWLKSLSLPFFISPFLEKSTTSANRCTKLKNSNEKILITSKNYGNGKVTLEYVDSPYTVLFTGTRYDQQNKEVTYNDRRKGYFTSNVYIEKSNEDAYDTEIYYLYKGTDSIDPTVITYSTYSPKGGDSIDIGVIPTFEGYGGNINYKYQVQLDGGFWITLTTTSMTSYSYTIPKGTTTFRARIQASDNTGFTSSDYVTGAVLTVINNIAPVISGSDSNLGTFNYNPPTISYVVTDENNDTVTVTVKLDGSTLDTRTVTLSQTYTVSLDWWDINTGSHTVTITANDGQGGTATRTYIFTKNSVGLISFNRLRKKTNTGYQTTYIETDSDSIITNNGQVLSERLESIASKLSVSISTTPTEMVSRHRLHIKLTSEYTIDYLEMYSTNVKVGSNTVEDILTQLENKVGISNSGTVPSDLNFERWRMKNSSGTYDIIYLEGVSEHIVCPCGKTVEERLIAIEAKL